MALSAPSFLSYCCSSDSRVPNLPFSIASRCSSRLFLSYPYSLSLYPLGAGGREVSVTAAAKSGGGGGSDDVRRNKSDKKKPKAEEVELEVEVEEEVPWIQDKALDLVEFTGSVSQAIPGPRVGQSSLPLMLAVPLAYVGLKFVIAFVKAVEKFGSSKEKRKSRVRKNARLCRSIDELFLKGEDALQHSALRGLQKKTGFDMEDILRKYMWYSLNEKPFNPKLVSNLIQLRKASELEDSQVAQILNEISRRIVNEKGPVAMDLSGYSEKGFERKLAVQALFGKMFYLSDLPEFCSRDNSLVVKEIFGVTDDDAEKLRLHTLSEAGDMGSLEKMINDDGSDSEDSNGESSSVPVP